MTTSVDVGDTRRVTATFVDVDDNAADPTTVVFAIREPDGTVTRYTSPNANLTNSATGTWFVDWTFSQSGRHYARFDGTGAVGASVITEIYALARNVPAAT